MITTGYDGISNSDKVVEDIEPTRSDGESIFRFCYISGFNFSHSL